MSHHVNEPPPSRGDVDPVFRELQVLASEIAKEWTDGPPSLGWLGEAFHWRSTGKDEDCEACTGLAREYLERRDVT